MPPDVAKAATVAEVNQQAKRADSPKRVVEKTGGWRSKELFSQAPRDFETLAL